MAIGTAVHDAGKITHPDEINGRGSEHESASERLLLGQGVRPTIACIYVEHGRLLEEEISRVEEGKWQLSRDRQRRQQPGNPKREVCSLAGLFASQ